MVSYPIARGFEGVAAYENPSDRNEECGMRSKLNPGSSLTRLKSERPMESRRPESVLAIFRKISSFLGRPSSIGDLSFRVFRERACSFRVLVPEYARLDGMILFTSGRSCGQSLFALGWGLGGSLGRIVPGV